MRDVARSAKGVMAMSGEAVAAMRADLWAKTRDRVKGHPVYAAGAAVVALLTLSGSLIQNWERVHNFVAPPPKAVRTNIEFVLDASNRMEQPYRDGTRFAIAKSELLSSLRGGSDSDVLGLRVFGHRRPADDSRTCEDTEVLVPLRTGAVEPIKRATGDVRPQGKSSLGKAVIEALSDFNDTNRFQAGKTRQTVVVITAGVDDCDLNFIETVRNRASRAPELVVEFKFVGLGVEQVQAAQVNELARAVRGEAVFVRDANELRQALTAVVVHAAFIENNRELITTLDQMTVGLNDAVVALGANDSNRAGTRAEDARVLFGRTDPVFDELAKREFDDTSRRVLGVLSEMRKTQGEEMDIVGQMVSAARAQDTALFNRLADDYNRKANTYNSGKREVERLLGTL
jgi:von Willebrand factor type A domain